MNILWSILTMVVGISAIIYTYKNANSKKDDIWDKTMTIRGYVGGILVLTIGVITLMRGW